MVVLDEFVQVGREALKDEAKVVVVYEGIQHPQKMVFVVFVRLGVELSHDS